MSYQPTLCYQCFGQRPEGPGPCPHCGWDPTAGREKYPLALPCGSILAGRYLVGRALGQGGFGITYVARDLTAGRLVAIKEYLPEGIALRTPGQTQVCALTQAQNENYQYGRSRFLEEARTLAQFNGHPGIVGVHTYFEENGTAYFAMDYLEGCSLKEYLIQRGGRIGCGEAWKLMRPVLSALSAVHAAGIVHRDVSPDNIYLCRGGEVKLLDFGAARSNLGERSHSMSVILKQGYAPMEQYLRRGSVGPWTDLYAFSATFYRAVTGLMPPDAPSRMEEDELILPTALVSMPGHWEEALLKGLAVRPADRWQTASAMMEAMEAREPELPLPSPTPPSPEPQLVAPQTFVPSPTPAQSILSQSVSTQPNTVHSEMPRSFSPQPTNPSSVRQQPVPPRPETPDMANPETPGIPCLAERKPRAVRRALLALLGAAAVVVLVCAGIALRDEEPGRVPDSAMAPPAQQDESGQAESMAESGLPIPQTNPFAVGNTSGNLNNGGLVLPDGGQRETDGFARQFLNLYNGRLYYHDTRDGGIYVQEGESQTALYKVGSNCDNLIITSSGLILLQHDEESGGHKVFFAAWETDGLTLRQEERIGVAYDEDCLFVWENALYYQDEHHQLQRFDLITGETTMVLDYFYPAACFEMDDKLYFIDSGTGVFSAVYEMDLRDGEDMEPVRVLDASDGDYISLKSLNGRDRKLYFTGRMANNRYFLYSHDIQTGTTRQIFAMPEMDRPIDMINVLPGSESGNLVLFRCSAGYEGDRYLLMDPESFFVARQYGGEAVQPILPEDGKAHGYIGDTFSSAFFDFTMDGAYLSSSYGSYDAGAGSQVLVMRVTVTNTTDYTYEMYDSDFALTWVDGDTTVYPITEYTDPVTEEQFPAVYELDPGESKSGLLVFQVPQDAVRFYLTYEEVFSGGRVGDSCTVEFWPTTL